MPPSVVAAKRTPTRRSQAGSSAEAAADAVAALPELNLSHQTKAMIV